MNKVLNIFRIMLTLITSCLFILFSLANYPNIVLITLNGLIFFFLFFTTLIDVFKKRTFNLKHNTINVIILTIILIVIIRPILDSYLVCGGSFIAANYIEFMAHLYGNHGFLMTMLFLIILSLNYIDYKLNN